MFCFLQLLQFVSGAWLYALKIGFVASDTLEYYVGSEEMIKIYPDRPDRFMPQKTLGGMLKMSVGHTLAFGLLCFMLTHLLRSLAKNSGRMRMADNLSFLFFGFALLDVFSGYAVRYGPVWTAAVRSSVFIGFELSGLSVIGALMYLGIRDD